MALHYLIALFQILFPILSGSFPAGGGSAPTFVNAAARSDFGSPGTALSIGTVQTGDYIDYFVSCPSNTCVFTMTDNCNTGGASDTNVVDTAATTQGTIAGTAQKGHFVVGLGRTGCTVSWSWTGGVGGTLAIAAVRGATAVQTSSFNNQAAAGTAANAVSSASITTSASSLCIGATIDQNLGGGTLTAGTTIAWTLGAVGATWPNGNEYFQQSASGAITATFTFSVSPYTQTGLTCYH